jgi:hypothetical protein
MVQFSTVLIHTSQDNVSNLKENEDLEIPFKYYLYTVLPLYPDNGG